MRIAIPAHNFLNHNTSRVKSGNSEQKSAIFVLAALFFNQLEIYCLHLCISIMDFSIFTLAQKKYFTNE